MRNSNKLSRWKKCISVLCLISLLLLSVPYALAQENVDSATSSAVPPELVPTSVHQFDNRLDSVVSVSAEFGDITSVTSDSATSTEILLPVPTHVLDSFPAFEATQSPTPIFQLAPTFTPTHAPVASASIKLPSSMRKLLKRDFQAHETISLVLDNATYSDVTAEVIDTTGQSIPVRMEKRSSGEGIILDIAPPYQFRSGRYTLRVKDWTGTIQEQDFTWGVLAFNTNKSIYLSKEIATIAMAVLDEGGRMVCNADVTLRIVPPNGDKALVLATSDGSIVVNKACTTHGVTTEPDYETKYTVGQSGKYLVTLTAHTANGNYTITDAFEVRDSVPFEVERVSATRIYPKSNYDVMFKIKANQDFVGQITERVPDSFQLSSIGDFPITRIATQSAAVVLTKPFEGRHATTLGFSETVKDPLVKKIYDTYGLRGHDGIDFSMKEGTPVLSVDDGTVVRVGWGDYGETMVIQHPWGKSYYGHLSKMIVPKGNVVVKGEPIGLSGNTGLTTGAHLHFGIKLNDNDNRNGYYGKIDPAPYFSEKGFTPMYQSKELVWDLELTKGQEIQIGYQYDAPNESPQFYLLGPLKFVDSQSRVAFEETRQWQIASDATFTMQTGYYMGTGVDNLAITGVGFSSPGFVMIKDDTADGTDGVAFKTSAMSGEVSSVLSDADADTATNAIQSMDGDGFTVGTDADVNTVNVRYAWIAFDGSDCTSSGTFCVGSYSGDGNPTQAITTVGFQPALVMIKRSGATAGVWRSSSMSTNVAQFFHALVQDTTGAYFTTLDATGFTVGNNAAVNTSANTYYYVAFKEVTGAMDVGSYTGNGSTQQITGPGFFPDYVFTKGADLTTEASAKFNLTESYGNYSGDFLDIANTTNWITSLDSTGFNLASTAAVNENTMTFFYAAFAGATDPSGSGTYKMTNGSYTGTGSAFSVTGMAFAPDLVIIKKDLDGTTETDTVFRTKHIGGDNSTYFTATGSYFAGGITSLNSDGFTLGTHATVNTNTKVYQWIAFGNAFNPMTNSGAADFAIGTFYGNTLDNRNITRVPFQPDLVMEKANGGPRTGVWRSSANSGDQTAFFSATAETTDRIQAFNTDGFQVGTNSDANRSGALMNWFAFKAGANMSVGTYSGTGSAQDITSPGFQPDWVWAKITSAAQSGAHHPSSLAGDNTQSFANVADFTGGITGFVSSGFSLGTSAIANTSGTNNYRFAAWKIPVAAGGPTLDQLMRHGAWFSSNVEQAFTF